MKKLQIFLALSLMLSANANAESIIVIDANGVVQRQIITTPTTYTTQTVTTTTSLPAQTVTATAPVVSVVRESPVVQNSYYYDSNATANALAAGVTTAVVGSLLYHGFNHHHRPHIGKPIGNHIGGGRHHRR